MAKYRISQLQDLEAGECPCGITRRAFANSLTGPASVHLVQIQKDARTHYHRRLTEIYLVLEGEGSIELDGETVRLKPLTAVLIEPGCRHRAVGNLTIVNISIPAFDPADEWFD